MSAPSPLDRVKDELARPGPRRATLIQVWHADGSLTTIPVAEGQGQPADLSPCKRDILAVLRVCGHRLTTAGVLAELDARELIHGESTVKGALAELVAAGLIDNDPKARPRGYGLPEWQTG